MVSVFRRNKGDGSGTIADLIADSVNETRHVVEDYWLNSAFLAGNQWLTWDDQDTRHQLMNLLSSDDRLRFTVNRMAANNRTLMANLMQRELHFEVTPNGADDASASAAHIAEEILHAMHEAHRWETLREEFCAAALKGGTAAIALDWDEASQDTVETVLTIADFVVESGAPDAETARWWVKLQALPPKMVQSIFKLPRCPDADARAGIRPLDSLVSDARTRGGTEYTMVYTYYERPNFLNEEGGFKVEVNGAVVQEGPWPFPFTDRLNLVVGRESIVDNTWYGHTIFTNTRGVQMALNLVKSSLMEHVRDTTASRMLVPHSAIRLMQSLADVPGYMYPYPDGTESPRWLTAPQLPHWFQMTPIDLMNDIDDLMGVHDVSRGRAPTNLESGTALAILAEQDGSPVGRLIKELSGCFSRLARMVLQLLEQEAKNKRLAVIDTGDGPLSIQWTGKDIQGQHMARVPLETIIPRSRAAQQELARTMVQMGMIEDVETYVRYAEAPGHRDLLKLVNPDAGRARRENTAMAQGRVQLPATYDDHQIHIAEHNRFRKTVAYEQMSADDQEKVDQHVQAHETMAAEQMAEQANRAEADPAMAAVPHRDGAPPVPPEALAPPPPPEAAVPGGPPLEPALEEVEPDALEEAGLGDPLDAVEMLFGDM